jgi:hypothetical protein
LLPDRYVLLNGPTVTADRVAQRKCRENQLLEKVIGKKINCKFIFKNTIYLCDARAYMIFFNNQLIGKVYFLFSFVIEQLGAGIFGRVFIAWAKQAAPRIRLLLLLPVKQLLMICRQMPLLLLLRGGGEGGGEGGGTPADLALWQTGGHSHAGLPGATPITYPLPHYYIVSTLTLGIYQRWLTIFKTTVGISFAIGLSILSSQWKKKFSLHSNMQQ